MSSRHTVTVGLLTLIAGSQFGGCPEPTVGIDLAARGGVSVRISQQTGSGLADASAAFYDTMAGLFNNPNLVLQSDQHLTVNGVPLTASWLLPAQNYATVNAVISPGAYAIAFDNGGAVAQMSAVPPAEVAITTPTEGASVSKSGFSILWTPGSDPNETIGVHVYGLISDPNAPGGTVGHYAYTAQVADSGSVAVGGTDLAPLLPGTIEIQVTRERTIPQTLGLAAGTVTLEIYQRRNLTLTN